MSIASIVVWLWLAAHPIETVNGLPVPEGCRVEHIVTAEGTSINTKLCGENAELHKVAEHVIEIRTKLEDKKPAIGVDRPGSPCNVDDGPYLTCITAPVTHWHCADADHQLEGGFDEVAFIDMEHPNKPYCVRVTREIWIDNVKYGILKESDAAQR